jgi:hypothetical protein
MRLDLLPFKTTFRNSHARKNFAMLKAWKKLPNRLPKSYQIEMRAKVKREEKLPNKNLKCALPIRTNHRNVIGK